MIKIIIVFTYIFLLFNPSFNSYASGHLIPLDGNEYQKITSMKDEVLYHINYGGTRTELNRDVRSDEVDMQKAYKIYSNSDLLASEDIKKALQDSHYIWQIPVYTDNYTVLVDITKVTSIPNNIPEDAKEMLKDDLNNWTVGAVYVYKTEIVDYNNTVITSMNGAGYNNDEYTYEIVSGIPGIRYPVALVFNSEEKPKYVIPAQKATAHAFNGEWPTVVKNKGDIDKYSGNEGTFPVYNYDDVVKASNSYYQNGMTGAGIFYEKNISNKVILLLSILGIVGVLLFNIVKRKTNVKM
ncbi:MAG: hypothetical protein Q4B86_05920 [Eubacteriales bacterium]|nr:hypothetical protein [Eubacteriales bacterium]